ncbi:peptidyl-glycine alpha-amidating monooxygenase B-like [Pomacea canaliculata]|uniref:peptidyl-glycine alpha-amidating monooxygenase B-like n=1 Tax=Pomacea canaliculata TaxID=400727 RepID=UPI000D72D188|nr:peptidyl-glycine alpha-amidating monooxygenase B-like [Pomacea canaliculata]
MLMVKCVLLLVCTTIVLSASIISAGTSGETIMDIKMKGAKPEEPDGYICTSYEVPYDEAYIIKYEAMADADTAHHILMYGCDGAAYSQADTWNCPAMCNDMASQKIIFAWAKNAPPAVLPQGVGFKVGRKSTIKTIVLQIHYAKSFSKMNSLISQVYVYT